MRCMVYYNLSQLWGSVPYITVPATSNNYDEILHSPYGHRKTFVGDCSMNCKTSPVCPEVV